MTIRPGARKRISGMNIALAFGLAPMLLPALSVADRGLLVTQAQAADCAETRHFVFQAVRPSGDDLVTHMPEITLSDDHVFDVLWPSGTQCGPYDRVTDFQLMSSQSSERTTMPYFYRAFHEDTDGDLVEAGFAKGTESQGQTDIFNGRDPRGVWQVTGVPALPPSNSIEYFRLSLALAEDAEPVPGVAQTDESDEVNGEGEEDAPASDEDETQTSGTSGSAGDSSGATGGGTVPVAENETEESESTEEKMISPEPAIAEDEEQTAQSFPGLVNEPSPVLLPDLADLLPTNDPEDSSQFMPEGEIEIVTSGNLEVPAWIEAGLDFTVRWNDRLSQRDRVTIVSAGTPDNELGSGRQNTRVGPRSSRSMLAPNELGTYEVRYISNADDSVHARVTVEVRDPYIQLEVDEQLHAGLSFDVSWDRRISQSDRVTIVPHDAPEDELGSGGQNARIGARSSRSLTAPDELGIYEVRYWRSNEERVVGGALVEVVDPEITLEVPDTAAQTQPQVQAQAQAQTSAESGAESEPEPGALSLEDERRVIMLITRLEGVSPDEQQPIIDELAGYGPGATDLLLEMMQEGLIYRPLALRAAAAIEADGEAPPPPPPQAQPSPQAPTQEPATQEPATQQAAQHPSGYQVVGVAPDDMLNVRDRAGVSGSTVIGQLAHDARNVVRSGDVQNVGGRDWWHVRHPALPSQGGWVNSRFLSTKAGLPPQEQAYRVTGVAANDRLNIRSHAGVENAVLASLSPDAEGLRWTGESVALSSGTWWEIAHPDLPGGTGWVNSRFLEVQEGVAVASVADPALADQRPAFTEAEGYTAIDADPAVNRLLDTLPQTSSVFPPGNELNPLTKAVLILENEEGVADHARYWIRYGMEERRDGLGGPPVPYSFVQVDRFNLGEVFREAVAESFGEGRTPPTEAFGAGEHVSFRFEFRPIQGRVADLVAMSRRVNSNSEAQGMECLTVMCLHLGSVGEGSIAWLDHEGSGTGFDRPYPDSRNDVYTPAAMLDLLTLEIGVARISDGQLIWAGFEESESVQPGEPFMETVMDVNLAQDFGIEAVLHWGNLMDDSVAAIWKRAITSPGAGDTPKLMLQRAFECARGQPSPEGLCP